MTPERYREVGQIFRAAAEIPPDRRAAFLDAACGEDKALRQEVESLFVHDAQGEGFIETLIATNTAGPTATADRPCDPVEANGDAIDQ